MRALFHRSSFWIVLVLIVAVAAGVIQKARGPKVQGVAATTRDLEQHIVASGRVWVPERISISPRTAGQVLAVAVVAGQRVKAGEVLVQLDDAEARNAVRQAESALAQAAARVEQLRRVGSIVATEALRRAQTELEHAQIHLAATERLSADRAVPTEALTDAKRAVELAQANRTAALAQQLAATPAGADSRVVLTAQLQAETQLEAAHLRLEQTHLFAPGDGVILTRSVERGDVVSPGQALLMLSADAKTQLAFQPDERNLALLALGQPAKASADAWPDTIFDAEIAYIAPAVDPQRGSIEVRLAVPQPPAFLKPEMTVSIDVAVAKHPGVLTLPSEAVRDARTPKPWVYVVVDGHVARREITLGIRGDGSTEIRSGLTAGEVAIVPHGELLTDGQRVRPEQD